MARTWITPKTDWKPTDYFNVGDHNRIGNNILVLFQLSLHIIGDYDLIDGVRWPTADGATYYVEVYNLLPKGTNSLNHNWFKLDLPYLKTFNVNDNTFTHQDLNDMESNLDAIHDSMVANIGLLPHLDFRFGNERGIQI